MENLCKNCGQCCKHVALEIDMPEDNDDYEDIYWYLLHENVSVFVTESDDDDDDEEEDWYVEFSTPCRALGDDNLCKEYQTRPGICRKYDPENCVASDGESEEIARFNTPEEFLEYLKKEKNIILNP